MLDEKDDTAKQIPFKLITTNQLWIPGEILSFVAISYCWHSDEWEVPNRFNGHLKNWDFPISLAMLKAILQRYIVNPGPMSCRAMWIDQICIDQENTEEKFHAVANLDVIYRNAFETSVLLEDIDVTLNEESLLSLLCTGQLYTAKTAPNQPAFFHLGDSEIDSNLQHCLGVGCGHALVDVMTKVFQSRWFSRAWCRHEYMLNSKAIFIVIGRKFPSISLSPKIFLEMYNQLEYQLDEREVGLDELASLPSVQDFISGINYRNEEYSAEGCLFELFVQLQLLFCSYERDIISISLNASGIRLSFNGDIARQRESRYILAMIALSAGDASVLGAEGSPMHRIDCPGHQPFLCWPRDYAISWPLRNTSSMPRIRDDTKISDITPEGISLGVFLLLSRPLAPPRKSRESAAGLWSSFLENEVFYDYSPEVLPSSRSEINLGIMACGLAFGLRWLNMASEYLKERWLDPENTNEVQCQSVMSVITSLSDEDSITVHDTPNSFRIVEFMFRLATCDDWFANLEDISPLRISLNSVGTAWAILLVPNHLAEEVSYVKYTIAVPVALNTAKALSVRRVWILEPAKTDEPALAVVGREFLIEQGPLNTEEHDNVRLVERVNVVGPWREDSFSDEDSSFGGSDTDGEL